MKSLPTLFLSASVCLVLGLVRPGVAGEGAWQVLFDGKDLSRWQSNDGGSPHANWQVDEGAMVRKDKAGDIWTKARFGDFVLELEFKTEGNSGIFFRTDHPRDPVQTGIEMAIDRPSAKPHTHSTGALYDLLAPRKTADKPVDQWNHAIITAKGSRIQVELNGEKVIDAELDRWTEPNKNPDGSRNKFNTALKDFKREGHIGFQDHGARVAFRNVRIQPLKNP